VRCCGPVTDCCAEQSYPVPRDLVLIFSRMTVTRLTF
jgi:hypothetical protein